MSIWSCLFQLVSFTDILRPFKLQVALPRSSPAFWDRPRVVILGARADVALTTPPGFLRYTTLILSGSNKRRQHGGGCWCQMHLDLGWPKTAATFASSELKAKSEKVRSFYARHLFPWKMITSKTKECANSKCSVGHQASLGHIIFPEARTRALRVFSQFTRGKQWFT